MKKLMKQTYTGGTQQPFLDFSFLKHLSIMRLVHLFALLYPFTALVSAVDSLKVTVYDGPTECADSEKVKNGDYLNMHYTGTIDESSETGEKGSKFDSSRDRGQTFDFQIGQGRVIKGCEFQISL
jgi:hypothetical protein